MKLWGHRTDKQGLESNKENKINRLHRLALEGIKIESKAMMAAGQGEPYKHEVRRRIYNALAKDKAKNPAQTLSGIMADYDKYPEDAKIYKDIGISREDFQEIAEEVLSAKLV